MLDFRKSLINGSLSKVLKRLHYPLVVMHHVRALVCGLPTERASHRGNDAGARRICGPHNGASLGNQNIAGVGRSFSKA
jgi:hypothetical protein